MKEGFPREFPNFKTWLSKEEDERISALFRYPGQPLILAGNQNDGVEKIFVRKKKYDLRDYSALVGGKCGGVMYRRHEGATADFIDYGKMIVFPADHDEGSVLAALQLGKQKWGAVELKGADDYKLLCVRIAVEHGIKVTNPELKADLQMFQRSKSRTRESDRSMDWER